MSRARSMSGTIPSMETSHDNLKDNTIIIGLCASAPGVGSRINF